MSQESDAPRTQIVEVQPPIKQRLTARQLELLRLIRKYREDHDGVSPSLDDMAEGMGCSRSGIVIKVNSMTARGLLARAVGAHRSLRLTKPALELVDYFDKIQANAG